MTGKLLITAALVTALNGSAIAQAPQLAPSVAERYLLAAANQDRVAHHLPLLQTEEHLSLAARLHAYEMVKHRTISHRFDGEADLAARAAEVGAHFSPDH